MPRDSTNPSGAGNVASVLSEASLRIVHSLVLDKSIGRLEARVLASHAWGVTPSWLIAHDTEVLTSQQHARFQALLDRRLIGEPIAYITGTQEFYGRSFSVSQAVLIPRPETELLVEVLLGQIPIHQPVDVLELGTGSGCIAISLALERPQARLTAVEKSATALSLAQKNAEELSARVEFMKSDWFSALVEHQFDFIISNPPYVPSDDPHLRRGGVQFEPLHALDSGPAGMDDIEHIIDHAPRFLKTKGGLFLEHGHDQAQLTTELLKKKGFSSIRTWQDLAGKDRTTAGFVSE